MQWMRRCVAAPAAVLLALLSTGCPAPVLDVSPAAVNIGAAQDTAELRINNRGSGTLTWTVEESLPWLSVEQDQKQAATQGSLTTETAVVKLRVIRSALVPGTTRGEITVKSNGGEVVVPVAAEQGGPATLQLSSGNLNFGSSVKQQTFTLSNGGLEPLTWTIAISASTPWLSATPRSGTISQQNGTQTITVNVNREGLAAGDFTGSLDFNSNAGRGNVNVNMSVLAYAVAPEALTFGLVDIPEFDTLTVSNSGSSSLQLDYTASSGEAINWLSIERSSDTIAANSQAQLRVSVNPAGLAAGAHNGVVTVTNPGSDASVTVPVSLEVSALRVAPEQLDFGADESSTTANLTVTNLSGQPVNYTIEVPVADRVWLSVEPPVATVGGTPSNHVVTVNRAGVDPGHYESTLTINYPTGSATVPVSMVRNPPPRLVVVSQNINFATTDSEEKIDIWNSGIGSIHWSIDTTDFPAWLSIAEAAGSSISGDVSGDHTDTVTLRVDRSAATPASQLDFAHSFDVVGTGDAIATLPVNVQMSIPPKPVIEIDTTDGANDGINDEGVHFVTVGVDVESKTFKIRNTGTGTLSWSFNTAQFPVWLTSFTPSQGGLDPNTEQSITVNVDRKTLDYNGAQVRLNLTTNDPKVSGGILPFIVEVQVPKTVAVTVRPPIIAFGPDESIGGIEVANDGDPGTVMLYRVRSTKNEWLKVFPDTGSSIGTDSIEKDYKGHTVTIVRSRLNGASSAGQLVVEAIRVNASGQIEVIPDIEPKTINVSVEAAQLTFETAKPRLRTPSQVRFVLLMRNLRFAPIPLSETRLGAIADNMQVLENDKPIEITETAKIAKGSSFIRGNLLVLLDYSNSMQEAARSVADVTISGAADPIQALYNKTISELFSEIPANYRVGLAIFSERSGTNGSGTSRDALRPILGTAAEGPDTEDELFVDDRSLLTARLANISVATNGATELYPAMSEASSLIAHEDSAAGIVPFDDADDRILLCVTDGRTTTPPGAATDILDQLKEVDHTRTFFIGWGQGVSSGELVLLANQTGGHLYSTDTQTVNDNGVEIEIPQVTELENFCKTDPDPCDLSVKRDLEAQYLFSYVSLTEENDVKIEGRLTFDDPNDDGNNCLKEQGEISGKFTATQNPLDLHSGDPRLAQIKLDYAGLQPDGTGHVVAYLDSAVRNMKHFSFQIDTLRADPLLRTKVTPVPRTSGGLIADWTFGGAGSTYTFDTPDETPLTFGDFGPLFTIDITGIQSDDLATAAPEGGLLNFNILAPVINVNDSNSQYVTAPDSLRLDTGKFLATSFPRPDIEIETINGAPADLTVHHFDRLPTGELVFDLGTDIDSFTFNFFNLGGSHEPTGFGLRYNITPSAAGIVAPPNGVDQRVWAAPLVFGTLDPVSRPFQVDRSTPQVIDGLTSDFDFKIDFEYKFEGMSYTGVIEPLYLRITILPPAVGVSSNAVAFPSGVVVQTLNVTNSGQGTLGWIIDSNDVFPSWLSLDKLGGTLLKGELDTLTLTASRTGLLVSPPPFTFHILSNDVNNPSTQAVTVTLQVP